MRFFFNRLKLFVFSKKFLKTTFCIVCVLFIVATPFFVFNKKNYELNLNELFLSPSSSKVVLTLYHVETFEGGTKNRSKFIDECAQNFNKKNKNFYLVAKTLSVEELLNSLEQKNYPDLYSFGTGVGEYLAGFFAELTPQKSIRNDLLSQSYLDGKLLCYPYIMSSYALIKNDTLSSKSAKNFNKQKNVNLINYSTNYLNSLQILCQTDFELSLNLTDKNLNFLKIYSSSYDAYVDFTKGQSVSLLGTLRDVARVKNREQNGSMSSCSYEYLSGYTDLMQFVGVVDSKSSQKTFWAKEFAKYLVSRESQERLKNYGLLSVTANKIYVDSYMSEIEDQMLSYQNILNPFISKEILSTLQQNSFSSLMSKYNFA